MDAITRRSTLAILASAGTATAGVAQPRAPGPAPRLTRGINIHHMLNWPEVRAGEGGTTYPRPAFAGERFATSDAELAALRRAGFDFVRLTADPSIWLSSSGDARAELAATSTRVVERLLDAGFGVVFDLHPVAVNPAVGPERLVAPDGDRLFASYVEVVAAVAAELGRLPPDRVALELMNEPSVSRATDWPRWQGMLERLHAAARGGAPSLPLILSGAAGSSHKSLPSLDLAPFRDSNVFYTFHYYDPPALTHQGVKVWVYGYLQDVKWPPSGGPEAVIAAAEARIDADSTLDAAGRQRTKIQTRMVVGNYFSQENGPAMIAGEFRKVGAWADAHGVARGRILLGEFGAVRPRADFDSGWLAWLSTVREAAETNGFAWAYWAYKGWGGMGLTEIKQPAPLAGDILGALGMSRA